MGLPWAIHGSSYTALYTPQQHLLSILISITTNEMDTDEATPEAVSQRHPAAGKQARNSVDMPERRVQGT
jgi:hypothetical protein